MARNLGPPLYEQARLDRALNRAFRQLASIQSDLRELDHLIEEAGGNIAPFIHEKEHLVQRAAALRILTDELFRAHELMEFQVLRAGADLCWLSGPDEYYLARTHRRSD